MGVAVGLVGQAVLVHVSFLAHKDVRGEEEREEEQVVTQPSGEHNFKSRNSPQLLPRTQSSPLIWQMRKLGPSMEKDLSLK